MNSVSELRQIITIYQNLRDEVSALKNKMMKLSQDQEQLIKELTASRKVRRSLLATDKSDFDRLEHHIVDGLAQLRKPAPIDALLEYLDVADTEAIPLNIIDRRSYLKRRLSIVMRTPSCRFMLINTHYGGRYVLKEWQH